MIIAAAGALFVIPSIAVQIRAIAGWIRSGPLTPEEIERTNIRSGWLGNRYDEDWEF